MANKPNFLRPNSTPKPADVRPGNASFFSSTHKNQDTGLKKAALADVNSRLVFGTKLV
jgi:hypothetical protein